MTQQSITRAVTYSDLRKHLAETMQHVCDAHEPVIITRQKARPVVMMSLEDYSSMTQTAYLLQSPANARRLRASLQAAASGQTQAHALHDAD